MNQQSAEKLTLNQVYDEITMISTAGSQAEAKLIQKTDQETYNKNQN